MLQTFPWKFAIFVKPWPRVISFKRDCTVVCVGTNQKPRPRYNPVGNARDKKKAARRGSPWSESRLDNDDHVNEHSGDIVDYRETACLGTIRTDNERVTLNN